jgi:GT2 family glycosyltransferase
MTISLIVPVLKRFDLFTELMATVDYPVLPIVIDNWRGNRGVSAAWNLGMKKSLQAGLNYAIISNDDVTFEPNVIEQLINTLKTTDAVMVSPNAYDKTDTPSLRTWTDYCCFAVDINKLISKVGWFDENFYPAYYEDNDMRRRVELAELDSFTRNDLKINHQVSATQFANPSNPVTSQIDMEKNYAYFVQKWGGSPYEEVYTNPFNNPDNDLAYWEKK